MGPKEWIRIIAFAGFIVYIMLPLTFGAIWLLNAPAATTGDAIALLESAAIPWWIGIAKAAPLFFVVFVVVLVWAGADEILG